MFQNSLSDYRILSLVGRPGAGKSTIGSIFARRLWCVHIEVSDIIREVVGDLSREELAATSERTKDDKCWLARKIVAEILRLEWEMEQNDIKHLMNYKDVVLTGIREPAINYCLLGTGAELSTVMVYASKEERYERLRALGKVESLEQFHVQEEIETNLGFSHLIAGSQEFIQTTSDTDPEELVDRFTHLVENRCN